MHKVKKRWMSWVGGTLVLACSVFFVRQVIQLVSGNDVDLRAHLHQLPAALGVYLVAFLLFAAAWHQLLRAAGSRSGYTLDLGIFTVSQFAKYLPGNFGHHAGRVILATKYGHQAPVVVVTMIGELALILGAMFLLSLPSLAGWIRRFDLDPSALVLVATGVGVSLALLAIVVARLQHHPRLSRLSEALLKLNAHKAHASFRMLLSFAAICAGIVVTALSLGLLDESRTLIMHAPILLTVFAASWLLGFVVPGAPAGIGIREIVLTEGLAPLVGRDQSVLLALLFRIVSTVADVTAFVLGAALLWNARRGITTAGRRPG